MSSPSSSTVTIDVLCSNIIGKEDREIDKKEHRGLFSPDIRAQTTLPRAEFRRSLRNKTERERFKDELIGGFLEPCLQKYGWTCSNEGCHNKSVGMMSQRFDDLDGTLPRQDGAQPGPRMILGCNFPVCDNEACKLRCTQRMDGIFLSPGGMQFSDQNIERNCSGCGKAARNMKHCAKCK